MARQCPLYRGKTRYFPGRSRLYRGKVTHFLGQWRQNLGNAAIFQARRGQARRGQARRGQARPGARRGQARCGSCGNGALACTRARFCSPGFRKHWPGRCSPSGIALWPAFWSLWKNEMVLRPAFWPHLQGPMCVPPTFWKGRAPKPKSVLFREDCFKFVKLVCNCMRILKKRCCGLHHSTKMKDENDKNDPTWVCGSGEKWWVRLPWVCGSGTGSKR